MARIKEARIGPQIAKGCARPPGTRERATRGVESVVEVAHTAVMSLLQIDEIESNSGRLNCANTWKCSIVFDLLYTKLMNKVQGVVRSHMRIRHVIFKVRSPSFDMMRVKTE